MVSPHCLSTSESMTRPPRIRHSTKGWAADCGQVEEGRPCFPLTLTGCLSLGILGNKVFTIAAMKSGAGQIVSGSPHNREAAREIVRQLGYGAWTLTGPSDYDAAMYPYDGALYVGAYAEGTLISNTDLVDASLKKGASLSKLFTVFPEHEILILGLHSVVNFWGYAYCRNSEIVRRRCGDADNGVTVDEGRLLPEEEAIFAESVEVHGKPVWRKKIKTRQYEFTEDQMGEEFVFALSKRIFGRSINEPEEDELVVMDRYVDQRPWWRRVLHSMGYGHGTR